MKYQIYEETFINPGTGLLTRRFKGHAVVTLDQKLGLVRINLNYMPARAKHGEIVDIVNRALTDFNLPGTMYYGGGRGQEQFHLNWIKLWNWKDFIKGETEVYLGEDCGPDPAAVAMGIKEPSNDYESDPVPVVLTREDWVEIYYALDSKMINKEQTRWAKHLKRIMDKIGPDGDIAAASGVEANG